MTHIICRLCCALAHIEKGFPNKAQFWYIFFIKFVHLEIFGMVYGIVSGMCKILYHTTYPTSTIPVNSIYALVMVVVVLPVLEL